MLEKISQVLNSNEQFQMDDTFHIEITHVRNPGTGSGRNQNKPGLTPVDQLLRRKKNVIRINNYDDLCCARAIVTAKAHQDYGSGHWITRSCNDVMPVNKPSVWPFKDAQATFYCPECCRSFFNRQCYQNHLFYTPSDRKADDNSVCQVKKRCPGCNKVNNGKRDIHEHQCGHSRCPSCHKYVEIGIHKCYIQPIVPESNMRKRKMDERVPPPLFVYFDIEAMQDTGIHVPNLMCSVTNEEDTSFIFNGPTCIEQFLTWLQTLTQTDDTEYLRQVIAVAHNFQGYDSYFILEELYKQCVCPDQIVNGAKILCMSLNHIKFIDSMAFLQMSLASFTKAFGLQELKKGFFPHFFNRAEFQHYVGPMPARDYYDPNSMKPERKQQFESWYQSKLDEQATFHLQQELIAYCQSDVQLLKQGCMKFQQEFKTLTNFNPMEQCITIASACNRFFRTNCILPGTLACEPVLGWYGSAKAHSIVALEWLNWVQHSEEKHILHAGNKREYQVSIGLSKTYVDGYDPNTNTIYEFNGCFFHGCLTCFNNRDQFHPKLNQQTMREVYQSTIQRIALHHLQQQVLYFDTDSVIYKWKPNAPELPLGQYLGQFTNELDDPNDYITEFAAAGPKNYGYRTLKGKTECKVSGFSLNTRGQEQLNFDILKKNIIEEIAQPQPTPNSIPVFNPHKIVRNPTTKQLSTETEIKRYQLVFDKRVVDSTNFQSYPYGYQGSHGIIDSSQDTPTQYPLVSLQSVIDSITQENMNIYQGLLDGTLDIFQ